MTSLLKFTYANNSGKNYFRKEIHNAWNKIHYFPRNMIVNVVYFNYYTKSILYSSDIMTLAGVIFYVHSYCNQYLFDLAHSKYINNFELSLIMKLKLFSKCCSR